MRIVRRGNRGQDGLGEWVHNFCERRLTRSVGWMAGWTECIRDEVRRAAVSDSSSHSISDSKGRYCLSGSVALLPGEGWAG